MSITTGDLLPIVQKALRDHAIQATEVSIIYSRKVDHYWRLNIAYKKQVAIGPLPVLWPAWALLLVDAETGEVLQFKEGWQWRE